MGRVRGRSGRGGGRSRATGADRAEPRVRLALQGRSCGIGTARSRRAGAGRGAAGPRVIAEAFQAYPFVEFLLGRGVDQELLDRGIALERHMEGEFKSHVLRASFVVAQLLKFTDRLDEARRTFTELLGDAVAHGVTGPDPADPVPPRRAGEPGGQLGCSHGARPGEHGGRPADRHGGDVVGGPLRGGPGGSPSGAGRPGEAGSPRGAAGRRGGGRDPSSSSRTCRSWGSSSFPWATSPRPMRICPGPSSSSNRWAFGSPRTSGSSRTRSRRSWPSGGSTKPRRSSRPSRTPAEASIGRGQGRPEPDAGRSCSRPGVISRVHLDAADEAVRHHDRLPLPFELGRTLLVRGNGAAPGEEEA